MGGGEWHPDPYGRAHLRLVAGGDWTGRVSTWGQEWVDPPGYSPGQIDASVLSEPVLTFSFLSTGLTGRGTWGVFDGAGNPKGEVVVEGTTGLRMKHDRRFVYLNTARQVVLVVDPPAQRGQHDIAVVDWAGRMHGTCTAAPFDDRTNFRVGESVVGWGPTVRSPFKFRVGTEERVEDQELPLLDVQGSTFASVVRHERVRYGANATVASVADPASSYFELCRSPQLPEPLRSFALAFPAVYAHRAHGWRQVSPNT